MSAITRTHAAQPNARAVPFSEALRFWIKLGFISFGGPTGQIAILHAEVVEKKKWISEERFLHALNYCMLLPGPEAQQLATYCGWLIHGTAGGIAAGVWFVLPSVFILLGLSWVYAAHGALPWVAAIFAGLQPAVLAIVAHAVMRIGTKVLHNGVMFAIAVTAFLALSVLHAPFPAVILSAGLLGYFGAIHWPRLFAVLKEKAPDPADAAPVAAILRPEHPFRRAFKVIALCSVLWLTPILALGLWRGWDSVFVAEGLFFSKAAMITFGGAYAVLPYVAQAAVEQHGWLSPSQMLDGLGLAETTPGPLIMVVQFVGFLGGWNNPNGLPPWLSATLGALITTWVTFVPCFLWIFLGAPHIERLRGNIKLTGALSAITAAVVGVVLNLAVWFAYHTAFPGQGSVNAFALLAAAIAFVGLWRWKWGVVPVVLGGGALGLLRYIVLTW